MPLSPQMQAAGSLFGSVPRGQFPDHPLDGLMFSLFGVALQPLGCLRHSGNQALVLGVDVPDAKPEFARSQSKLSEFTHLLLLRPARESEAAQVLPPAECLQALSAERNGGGVLQVSPIGEPVPYTRTL